MEYAITCEGLSKRYGPVAALDSLRLAVPTGTIYGLLGPNGAGKTTLTRILTGLIRPSGGSATVAGRDIATGGMALRRSISVLEQQPRYYGWMRGRELLELSGELFGLHGHELHDRVATVLEVAGLTTAANRRIGGYSGGMRQRLGLAQALINDPAVLFLDEPVSALDPEGRHAILNAIAALRGQRTVFMSTHLLQDVERICDHVAIIDHGRLVVAATVSELQERYAQPIYQLDPEIGQEAAVAALITDLRGQPWCSGVVQDAGTLRIMVSDVTAASAALLPLIARHAVRAQRFERGRPSLEDIFLRLVGTALASPAHGTAAQPLTSEVTG